MKRFFLLFIGILMVYAAFSQKTTISGVVRDGQTMETLIGANVIVGAGVGTITDFDGRFMLEVSPGDYELKVSYVGYLEYSKKVTVGNKSLTFDIKLETLVLDEVSVVADVARARQTPIAFTNVLPAKIEEQLAGRDIPMILNSTPGVYATQQGGGDGDAKITLRGFNQRNVAVMIDGIPVNDMENGWVYWSNWFGLDAVTRTLQVQRGLGASKLALPSVGGTINIITKGYDTKQEGKFSQEIDLEGKYRSSIGFTSGKLKNGWSFTLAGSRKWGMTWVENTKTEGWFYYAKIDKRWNNHISTISAMGAPQQHDQRSYKLPIAVYSGKMAEKLNIELKGRTTSDTTLRSMYPFYDMGINYNQHWGYLYRNAENWNESHTQRVIDSTSKREVLNEKVNIYHKPQFSIRDFWNINDKLTISNIIYLSIGKGGGVGMYNSFKNAYQPLITPWVLNSESPEFGQLNWQKLYQQNSTFEQNPFDTTVHHSFPSDNFLIIAKNEHFWYGYVGTVNYKINNLLEFSGGLDLRSYEGIHYKEVYDLIGGDYYELADNLNDPASYVKHKGDKIEYYYNGYVKWKGFFSQVEYKGPIYSAFLNITGAQSQYKMKNFFILNQKESPWKKIYGGTIKGGFNFNLNEKSNIFINMGYLSKARDYNYFFVGRSAEFSKNIKNEIVKAVELGYSLNYNSFNINFNLYSTNWQNKAARDISYNNGEGVGYIPGLDAKHKGIEIDFTYTPIKKLEVKGIISVGDWKWDTYVKDLVIYTTNTTNPLDTIDFDCRNIHVSEGAQTQLSGNVRYQIIKGLYVMSEITYFSRYYSEFTPETLSPTGEPTDSWIVPEYFIVDLHSGYSWRPKSYDKIKMSIKLNFLNVLNTLYISDAVNNDSNHPLNGWKINSGTIGTTYDANSATVFFGPPRTITGTFEIQF